MLVWLSIVGVVAVLWAVGHFGSKWSKGHDDFYESPDEDEPAD